MATVGLGPQPIALNRSPRSPAAFLFSNDAMLVR
jgi:hypothetical protein